MAKSNKVVSIKQDQSGPELVLQADERAAKQYVTEFVQVDGKLDGIERTFCKAFAENHEGHTAPQLKTAFAALRESGVFAQLSKQHVDNISSTAQWIAALPYNDQDDLFESENFRTAYRAMRWPAKAPAPKTGPVEDADSEPTGTRAPSQPSRGPVTIDQECNDVTMELNSVIEHIGDIMSKYPQHVYAPALEMLARDIGAAIEKAAQVRLQYASKNNVRYEIEEIAA